MFHASRAPVTISKVDNVLIAAVDHPPVNALAQVVRAGLADVIDKFSDDAQSSAMVLLCRGRTFFAGADIREFGAPMQAPALGEIIARLDRCAKPIIAAIHGAALGGGLEVALACNYRIATPGARFGFPEVNLGLLPGSGGIVRLPRLIGIAPALKMISEGDEISAAEARLNGLVDEIAKGDLEADAIAFARRAIASGAAIQRTSDRPFPAFDGEMAAASRATLAKKYRGFNAPQIAVDLLEMAASTPFAEAAEREYANCKSLIASPQSKALRHLFAAERAAQKIDAETDSAPIRDVRRVAVIGTGVMGRGISLCFLDAGYSVTLLGRGDASLKAARDSVEKSYRGRIARGALAEPAMTERLSRLKLTTSYADLADADLVVETIAEDIDAKRAVFQRLNDVARPDAILATNASFLDIEDIASASERPENVVGMHFFNPPSIMKLLENVRTKRSAPEVLATVMKLGKSLGKIPVMVGRSEGFVANRMLSRRTREALFLLEEGATPWQIDVALTRFGFPMGPFALADLAGLDVIAATRRARLASLSPREQTCDIIDQLVAAGRLGQKTGAGYYDYDEKKKAAPSLEVEVLLEKHRQRRGFIGPAITDQEILERCLYAMINESAKILDEGGAARAGDIDVIWTRGFGFPAYLGGPMFYADQIGLPAIREALDRYSTSVGADYFKPAPLITQLIAQGRGFHG